MRTTPINSYFFEKNRQKLLKLLPPHSLAIIPAASNIVCTADQHFPFRQNSDFYYLTGINHANVMLLLSPDHDRADFREVLFIPEITEHDKTWNGNILTPEKATLLSGIKKIMFVNEFEAVVSNFAEKVKTFYLPITDIAKTAEDIPVGQRKLAHYLQEVHPLHHFERLTPIIHDLRRIKEEAEIQQIKKAIDITRKGFLNSLKVIEPGKREFEIEAEITAELIRNGAHGHGFLPIVASGANACVLHYINNDCICNDGDLVLMDIGAEYNYYNADITRTVPVNGRFTNRQRQIYEAVYRLHNNIMSMIKPGISIETLNQQTIPFIEKELVDLKLLTTAEIKKQQPEKLLYRKYLMHGVSHSLGIDVHDPNNKHDILEEGMVITCEPGLYIAEENIGIRLENDILITQNGCINLSADIPIDPESIESLMQ